LEAPHLISYRNLLEDNLGLQRVDDQAEILHGNEKQRFIIVCEICYLEGVEAAGLGGEVLDVVHFVG
jgi:hypothetical protein